MRNKKILKKYLVLGALFLNIQFLDSRYIIITSLVIFFVMIIMLYISEKSIDTTSKKNQSLILIIIIFGYYIAQLGYIIYVSQNGYPIDIWISSGFRELTGRTVIAFQPLIFLLTYISFKKLSAIITRKELRPQSNPANPIS
jgi:D-alanyl-lipoteichoic acid acyltransferase DltB (MBOAT superfamily)